MWPVNTVFRVFITHVLGKVLCTTMRGESEDVDYAVSTARKAHATWSKLTPHERARHLYRCVQVVKPNSKTWNPHSSCKSLFGLLAKIKVLSVLPAHLPLVLDAGVLVSVPPLSCAGFVRCHCTRRWAVLDNAHDKDSGAFR